MAITNIDEKKTEFLSFCIDACKNKIRYLQMTKKLKNTQQHS